MRLIHSQPGDRAAAGPWRGSVTAQVTPYRDGKVDRSALAVLCERQADRATAGLVLCGSTGEGNLLSAAEQALVLDVAKEAAGARMPLMAGCSAFSTEAAVALAAQAVRHSASALLCAPPPYVKPSQGGIIAHIRAVAEAAGMPIMLYDVPGRVGVAVADSTVARLFEAGLIFGLKDAGGDLARPPRLRALCGEGLVQLCGDDACTPAHLAMGGDGCISVTANVVPALCAALHRAWDRGELAAAGRLRDKLAPLHDAMFAQTNPVPVKAALYLAGLCKADVRLPLVAAEDPTVERLSALLPALLEADDAAVDRSVLSVVA